VNLAALTVARRSHAPGAADPAQTAARRRERPTEQPARPDEHIVEAPGDDSRLPGPRLRRSLGRITRRHLGFAAGGLAAGWVTLVIAGAVGDSAAVNERAAALRAENTALTERLEAIRREAALVQGEAYISLEARAYGMGRGRERTFTLNRDAPPPPRLSLLGDASGEGDAASPLEEWLRLLFGS
jgi:hypothetical protein